MASFTSDTVDSLEVRPLVNISSSKTLAKNEAGKSIVRSNAALDVDVGNKESFGGQTNDQSNIDEESSRQVPKKVPFCPEVITLRSDTVCKFEMKKHKKKSSGDKTKTSRNEDITKPYYYYPWRHSQRRYFTASPFPTPSHSGTAVKPKRKRSSGSHGSGIESKKLKMSGPRVTSLMRLNEICPGLCYNYSDPIGPPHETVFEVTVFYTPNEKQYEGRGRSKKLAKQNVAEKILADIGQSVSANSTEGDLAIQENLLQPDFETSPQLSEETSLPERSLINYGDIAFAEDETIDFTSDDIPMCGLRTLQPIPEPSYVSQTLIKRLKRSNVGENPCGAFNSLMGCDGEFKYDFLPEDEQSLPHERVFYAKLTFKIPSCMTTNQSDVNERVFVGAGSNKKKAKGEAARLGLISILGLECYNAMVNAQTENAAFLSAAAARIGKTVPHSVSAVGASKSDSSSHEVDDPDPESMEYSLEFSQQVAKAVTEKHSELVKNDEKCSSQKVIAGVVVTLGSPMIENMHVVCVATGTKCISGDFMSEKGLSLNDCHAEILATRCLRDFLYSQIDVLRSKLNKSDKNAESLDGVILEQIKNIPNEVVQFKLKDGVKFHLYISTSPCGDARIFSPKGIELSDDEESNQSTCAPGEEQTDAHPNRNNRGILRAKIEAGEGTIPVANLADGGPQTWDGIILGNALRTMSCSDKICMWNVVGLQGSLLSLFMEPVYYSSIVLGSLHHPVHFKRAVYSRIQNLPNIENPFRINCPHLLMVADKGKRRVVKSPNHSIAWTCSWNSHEVISSSKGRCEPGGVVSRLTKRLAFIRFLKIYKNETGKRENFANITYEDAKKLAVMYQITKRKFVDFMRASGYGTWISKPIEQDGFYL